MCGMAGLVGIQIPCDEASMRVRSMYDAIVHRGADSDGYGVADGAALGMHHLIANATPCFAWSARKRRSRR
jgi:asparagine synthetase B (glutamine-hydrolysing)